MYSFFERYILKKTLKKGDRNNIDDYIPLKDEYSLLPTVDVDSTGTKLNSIINDELLHIKKIHKLLIISLLGTIAGYYLALIICGNLFAFDRTTFAIYIAFPFLLFSSLAWLTFEILTNSGSIDSFINNHYYRYKIIDYWNRIETRLKELSIEENSGNTYLNYEEDYSSMRYVYKILLSLKNSKDKSTINVYHKIIYVLEARNNLIYGGGFVTYKELKQMKLDTKFVLEKLRTAYAYV